MNVLIYGFGRMGLTHFSILKGLNTEINFTVIEPSKIIRIFLKSNLDIKILKDDSSINDLQDITIITTPPFIHERILDKCIIRGDKKVFVEKPFGGYTNITEKYASNKNIYIGYVLRFNPCIQWVKKNINIPDVVSIKGEYLSNTIIKKPVGWRNGPYSGVLNEVGSHIIDLIQYLLSSTSFVIDESYEKSVVSDIDDITETKITFDKSKVVFLYFNWVKKEIRKPVFSLNIKMRNDVNFIVDQQQIKKFNKSGKLISTISVADICEKVPFYLRGIDFTKQMQDLLGDCNTLSTTKEAYFVNKIMNKIKLHENNTRR